MLCLAISFLWSYLFQGLSGQFIENFACHDRLVKINDLVNVQPLLVQGSFSLECLMMGIPCSADTEAFAAS